MRSFSFQLNCLFSRHVGVGDASVKNSSAGPVEQHYSSSVTTNILTSPGNGNPESPLADTATSENV